MKNIYFGFAAWVLSATAQADPLTTCPAEAFLVQGTPAELFAVDLSSGFYRSLSDSMGTASTLNALAFNFHDQYLYAWNKALESPVRIGDDYQMEALDVTGDIGGHYYVGDISPSENAYYVYRKGSNAVHGFWRVSLDPNTDDYLSASRIINGSQMYLNIFDFAFSPIDDLIYSVDRNGNLFQIDPADGSFINMGNTGQRGTFGAVYFDVDGQFYISNNLTGRIFQIDIESGVYTAVAFAQGPSSSTNDGARCAFAAVVPMETTNLDYGDAPDSYGTILSSNGARHDVGESNLMLGALADVEAQAFASPNSDDAVGDDDEDGIEFISALSAGSQAIVNVEIVGSGNLNAWIDFDLDGTFDAGEQIFDDLSVTTGSRNLVFDVPQSAVEGTTWSRFRLSTSAGVQATGGVSDGEVEDHTVAISASTVTKQFYPSSDGFSTIAFEDLWPSRGDYDMNDFVTHYRTGYSTTGSQVTAISISGEILAMGATFHNGFAVSIDGLPRDFIDEATIEYEVNGVLQQLSPLEAGQSNAVFVIANDLWDYVQPAEGCSFYRTEANCGESPIQFSFRIDAQLSTPVEESSIERGLFNPFLFATHGYNRNSIFNSPPGRPLEIHLKNSIPSDLADQALLGRADDRTNVGQALYYQTANGLPWALEIGTEWSHPGEYMDLVEAYPKFINFVQSEGEEDQDWYLLENAVAEKLYE